MLQIIDCSWQFHLLPLMATLRRFSKFFSRESVIVKRERLVQTVWMIVLCISSFALCPLSFAIVYVDLNAPIGTNDGTSWANAYLSIHSAISDSASATEQIWVADGTYETSFTLKSNRKLYGGFEGYAGAEETLLSQRDWEANVVMIDGSTAQSGGSAWHVVTMDGVANTRLDGFTITGGAADGTGHNAHGGGIYCNSVDGSNIITNCNLFGNYADEYGGGVYCGDHSSPVITTCVFQWNSGGGGGGIACVSYSTPIIADCDFTINLGVNGGGVCCFDHSSPEITTCTITGNLSTFGGGVCCAEESSPRITDCIISGNFNMGGIDMGGGICCFISSSPVITNCVISSNFSAYGGGVFSAYYCSPEITNCTISSNFSMAGSGICCWFESGSVLTNNIIENNSYGAIAVFDVESSATVKNCLFYANPDGAYLDVEKGVYTDSQVDDLNAQVTEASGNITGNPAFFMDGDEGTSGTWTDVLDTPPLTILTDSSANFTPGALKGRLVSVGTPSLGFQLAVLDNSITTMSVFAIVPVNVGDSYKIVDYHLTKYSAAMDVGVPFGAPSTDIEGSSRPALMGYDIGAYEFQCSSIGPRDIYIFPRSIDFGNQPVNQGASAAQTVSIWNIGGGSLAISSVNLAGADPGEFLISSDSGESALSSCSHREIEIAFDPSSLGAKSASLDIQSNDSDEPTTTVNLCGVSTNTAPVILDDDIVIPTDEDTDKLVTLNGFDADGDLLTAIVIQLPIQWMGELYQYNAGVRGSKIESVPAVLTDSQMRLIYAPENRAYTYNSVLRWKVNDGLVDSDNTGTCTLTVVADIDPPALDSITLADPDGGPEAEYTDDQTVRVNLGSRSGDLPDAIHLSEDSGFSSYISIPYTGQTSVSFTLSGGDGLKTVYARLKGPAGPGGTVSDTITLDTTNPAGSVSIDSGAPFTNNTVSNLTLSATDFGGSGVADMQFKNEGEAWSSWETFATGKVWALTGGEGIKRVFVEYRDKLGHISTDITSDTITVDQTKPESEVTSPSGISHQTVLTVHWTSSDPGTYPSGVDSVSVYWKLDSGSWAFFGTYPAGTNSTSFDTSTYSDGNYSFYSVATDVAGNVEDTPTTGDVTVTVNNRPIQVKEWNCPATQGWAKTDPPDGTFIDAPDGSFYIATRVTDGCSIGVSGRTGGTPSVYASWESPSDEVAYVPNSVYRIKYTIRTTQTNQNRVPNCRLFSECIGTDMLAVASGNRLGKGIFAPDTAGKTYSVYFGPPNLTGTGITNIKVKFEVIDFADDEEGTNYLDSVIVERFETYPRSEGTLVREFNTQIDFSSWTSNTLGSPFGDATLGLSPSGLYIETPAEVTSPEGAVDFGMWSLPADKSTESFEANRLYRCVYTLSSPAQGTLGKIRLYNANLVNNWISMIVLLSGQIQSHMPDADGEEYDLWFETSPSLYTGAEAVNNKISYNFDLSDGSDTEEGGVTLSRVELYTYDIP